MTYPYCSLQARLRRLGACDEAIAWTQGRTLEQVWDDCERGDWLMWLATRMLTVTRKDLVAVAVRCVRLLLRDPTREQEAMPPAAATWLRLAIAVAEDWLAARNIAGCLNNRRDLIRAYRSESSPRAAGYMHAGLCLLHLLDRQEAADDVVAEVCNSLAAPLDFCDEWKNRAAVAQKQCADIVRDLIACPTMDDLYRDFPEERQS